MEIDEDYIMVLTTTGSEHKAEEISKELVEQELSACVQVYGPIKSTYSWKGEVTSGEEWVCLVKTHRDFYESLESKLKEIHSYENPEIVALPIIDGSEDYLDWIDDNVKD